MTSNAFSPSAKLVTIFGGSGFLGRHVVRALARRGYRIRVAVRRPDLANHLQPLGTVGQITAVQANVRYQKSILRAAQGSDVIINLVGILQQTGRQSFGAVQQNGARIIAEAAAAQSARLIHISAIGADADSSSIYAKTKALGEESAFSAVPDAIVFRPSVMFGPEDTFFNRFAQLTKTLPVLPLVGGSTRFQPVFVGDVAEAIARAVDGSVAGGKVYELGGAEICSLRTLVDYVQTVIACKRPVAALPFCIAHMQAAVVEYLDKLTLGIIPDTFIITRDQVKLLAVDNVVSEKALAEGRTLEGLGINPETYQAIVPTYLWRFRKSGQFNTARS